MPNRIGDFELVDHILIQPLNLNRAIQRTIALMVRDLGVSVRHKNPFMKRITPFEIVFLWAPAIRNSVLMPNGDCSTGLTRKVI